MFERLFLFIQASNRKERIGLSFYFYPLMLLHLRKMIENKCDKDVEKREPSYTVGGNANWYSHYGKQCGDFLNKWK